MEFKTIKETELKFGDNNYIMIAKKVAITSDGNKPFISLIRGYYHDGDKRDVKALSLPSDDLKFIRDVIGVMTGLLEY